MILRRTTTLAIAACGGLTACGESAERLREAQRYSCTQLAREIGKHEQRRDTAQIDGLFSSIDAAVNSDAAERRTADIQSGVFALDEADAEKSLSQLEEIYRNKGCR